ncbi:MAG TPA: hypothetical protein VM681_00350, partial [Candidatus Thermoplasmatota archaeon]|nr:hypothetical protein [Candidatus Thermoplasmatota archaeon]
MDWKLPAGVMAIAAVVMLLVPLVNHLAGGLDSLVQDLVDDRQQPSDGRDRHHAGREFPIHAFR